MSNNSGNTLIPYATKTWSPITGCTPCSPACENCWAQSLAERFPQTHAGKEICHDGEARPVAFSQIVIHSDRLKKPLSWDIPQVVFVCPRSDLFHEDVPDEQIFDIFNIMEQASQHTFLVLTKRPERMCDVLGGISGAGLSAPGLPNVYLGVTAWDQLSWDVLVNWLFTVPAAGYWVSLEPLLGPIQVAQLGRRILPWVDQIIIGCEQVNGHREGRLMERWWAENIQHDCDKYGVNCYLKQTATDGKVYQHAPQPHELAWDL